MDWLSLSELVDSLVELSETLLSLSLELLLLERFKLVDGESLACEEFDCDSLESD